MTIVFYIKFILIAILLPAGDYNSANYNNYYNEGLFQG